MGFWGLICALTHRATTTTWSFPPSPRHHLLVLNLSVLGWFQTFSRCLKCRIMPGTLLTARYHLSGQMSSEENGTFQETCPYCFQLLVLDNSRVRLKPKAKLTPKIQKLLNREARNHTLSFKEAKLLRKYKDSASVLLVTCRTCNRTVKHHGKSRSFLSALKNNAAPATNKANLKTPKRKTPGSTHSAHNVSGSKGKSPSLTIRTPVSGQSTPICSSRNGSKRKKHFSQLKALLSQSASEKSPKLDFRHFLSSL
ncbi:UPF0711 protein C18orf21 homolog isoform X1 [Mesocricetus auratus]|uniref:UPF0711 protein C18orf21 homolog isoform X1 n=1 Tax=Mesocricetus auratus TaxID=10036 RepID=A0ABM2YGH2_MESAU|nr:UPF0711 protein C18orf21 homolog isoform X1 [Mesocricetus auratus]